MIHSAGQVCTCSHMKKYRVNFFLVSVQEIWMIERSEVFGDGIIIQMKLKDDSFPPGSIQFAVRSFLYPVSGGDRISNSVSAEYLRLDIRIQPEMRCQAGPQILYPGFNAYPVHP